MTSTDSIYTLPPGKHAGMALRLLVLSLFPMMFLWIICGCNVNTPPQDLTVISGPTMGTMYSIKAVKHGGIADVELRDIKAGITRLLTTVNDQMSIYQRDSEISMFNKSNSTDWFELSPATVEVFALADNISRRTNGAFDITVGPLVNLWGFGPEKRKTGVPSDNDIAIALQTVGYDKLSVWFSPPSVRKQTARIYCDLAAIAKGYAVDLVGAYLDSSGIHDYLVEIGGEVKAKGHNESGDTWNVGIATPDNDLGIQKVVTLKDASMATSGDYRNFFESKGNRYSHTIDPRTGHPVEHTLAAVTVIHDSCSVADAMATALEVLGPERGYQLAEKQSLAAYFIIRTDTGFVEMMTPMFGQHLTP